MRITIFTALLFLMACGTNEEATNQTEKKLSVVASASIFADMAQNITGDLIEVKTIVPIGSDPHLHEATPRDARLVSKADLILRNGLTFEGWLAELIENAGTKAEVVLITKGINAIESDKYANSADPHAWMSAKNGLIYIENIKNALVQLAPQYAEEFNFNYGVYKKQLEDLDTYIATEVQKIPASRRILITSHDAFKYYGNEYGIQLEAALGVSTDAEVQVSDITRLNRVIRESKIPAIFVESTINPKLLKQLAVDNKIEIGGELFADSIGDKESDAPSYHAMLKHNTDVIVAALSK